MPKPLLILLTLPVSSQHLFSPVKFSHQIEREEAEGNLTPSRAGFLYSLIGAYHRAATYSDIPVSWGVDTLERSDEGALFNMGFAAML